MKMSLYQCCDVAAKLTEIACQPGRDKLAAQVQPSPDGKLDPATQTECLYVWEVYKVMAAAVIASQEQGGVFADKGVAPDAGSVLGKLQPLLDGVLPLLGGNAGNLVKLVEGLLSGSSPDPVPAGSPVPLNASAGS